MKYLLFAGWMVLALIHMSPGSEGVTPPSSSPQNKCTECHDDITKFKSIHPALEGGCETCHEPSGPDHPEKDGFTLVEKVPALCFVCHEEFGKKNIHPPAKEGDCLSCHSPHGSDNAALLTEPPGKLCMVCHDKEVPANYRAHFSYFESSCNDCHEPHQSDYPSLLKEPVPAICFECHENEAESKGLESVHYPYTEDVCTSCHQPHGAGIAGLLTEKIPDLCYICHEEISAAYPHAPVKNGRCTECHKPHTSDQATLLVSDNKALCLKCHSRSYSTDSSFVENIGLQIKNDSYIHGAIEMDGCASCHAGHGTDNPDLLHNKYPSAFYTDGRPETFALCFDCHDAAMLQKDPEASGTGFRKDTVNLHFVHVSEPPGRSCSMCHDVHAAPNEHLIRAEVPYGKWTMKMNYTVTENGGSCMPGCHGKLSYEH